MIGINRREFVRDAVGAGVALGLKPSVLRTTGRHGTNTAVAIDPYSLVDPELLATVKAMPKATPGTPNLAAMRSSAAWTPLPPPAPQLVDRHIPGPKGAPDLHLVIVDPAPGARNRPALLHIHGGGYVAGTAGLFSTVLQRTAQTCGCLVVSVNYRLAPETRFPGSLEDNYTALKWLYANADKLGVDRKRVAVGGESAGGGHSAALAIAARDRREIPIAFQLLIYPMLDDQTGSSRAVPSHIGAFVWTAENNVFGWTSLLGVPAGSKDVPAGSVPARVRNLAGLPPAFIGVGSIDLFVDEDIDYARRLVDAGVPTELHVIPGAYHGFNLLVPNATVTSRFTESWTSALKRGLARTS